MDFLNFDSDLRLAAWNEWKVVCSIEGLAEQGKQEYRDVLANTVVNAFRRKAAKLLGFEEAGQLPPEECIQEFDSALVLREHAPGDNRQTGKERQKKVWKDFVWGKVSESSEPPLKVIHGMLVGPLGVMCAIVEEYVRNNYSGFLKEHGFIGTISTNEEIFGKDGSSVTIEDLLEAPKKLIDAEEQAIEDELEKLMRDRFSREELACLCAKGNAIAMTNRELLNFCGFESSKANEVCCEALEKLEKMILELFPEDESHVVCASLENVLKKLLSAEKGAHGLLMEVDKEAKN